MKGFKKDGKFIPTGNRNKSPRITIKQFGDMYTIQKNGKEIKGLEEPMHYSNAEYNANILRKQIKENKNRV